MIQWWFSHEKTCFNMIQPCVDGFNNYNGLYIYIYITLHYIGAFNQQICGRLYPTGLCGYNDSIQPGSGYIYYIYIIL